MTAQQTLFDVGHLSDMSDTVSDKTSKPEKTLREAKTAKTLSPGNIDILYKLLIPLREKFYGGVSDMSDMSDMSDSNPACQLTAIWIAAYNSPAVTPASRGVMPALSWLAFCHQCEIKERFTDHNERDVWLMCHRREYPHHRTMEGAGK